MKKIERVKGDRKVSINVSFMQLYNERIYDLLNREMFKGRKNSVIGEGLKLKWNKYDVYTVENLLTVEIDEVEEILHLFHYGIQNKILGSHKMNMTSSRSHTIFTVTLEQIPIDNPDNTIVSKLQIVDLAGSERQSLTGSDGKMAKEAIGINKSLFTLRKVISALTERNQGGGGEGEASYIPYRDSKLTCLLR